MNDELLHLQTFALDASEILRDEQGNERDQKTSERIKHSNIIAETRDMLLEGLKRMQVISAAIAASSLTCGSRTNLRKS